MQNHSAILWRQVTGALALAGLVWAAAAIAAPPAQAQTYSVLYSFKGGTADGENPEAGLLMDKAGNLYGTTVEGPQCSPAPCTNLSGIVFKLGTTGTETVLHKFRGCCTSSGSPDGANPYGGLISDSAGHFYGMSSAGGTSHSGVVFKVGSTGETLVHTFTGPPGDGAFPYGSLTRDSTGNLYGTTSAGGASNSGVVFKLDTTGTETVLYSFKGGADGAFPYGRLLRDSAGSLYGTTPAGGIMSGNCFPYGCGVVFKVDTTGTETVLYSFTGGATDGAYPYAGLITDSTGNLYGTTYNGGAGGCSNGCGVVFKLAPGTGVLTLLHSFAGYPTDGAFPYAGLVRDSTGNLYGTAVYGGASNNGVVFKVDTTDTETVLYTFTGKTDGGVPRAPLTLDSKGNLYGTAYSDGVFGKACGGSTEDSCGVVFKLTR